MTRHVLTAAHCLQYNSESGEIEYVYDEITITLGTIKLVQTDGHQSGQQFIIISGEHDLFDRSESITFVSKAKKNERKHHEKFFIRRSRGQSKYDFALLTLEKPVDFKKYPHIR